MKDGQYYGKESIALASMSVDEVGVWLAYLGLVGEKVCQEDERWVVVAPSKGGAQRR